MHRDGPRGTHVTRILDRVIANLHVALWPTLSLSLSYRSDPISPACVTVTRRAACTVTRRVRVQSRSRDWADEMMMMQNRDDL